MLNLMISGCVTQSGPSDDRIVCSSRQSILPLRTISFLRSTREDAVRESSGCSKITEGKTMSLRTIISLALATALGVACVSTDALAYRAVHRGGAVGVGGVYRGGVYRGAYVRPGVRVGVGAAAVGAAVAAPYYYGRPACGYYPYGPC
jgi:hypothetical protein